MISVIRLQGKKDLIFHCRLLYLEHLELSFYGMTPGFLQLILFTLYIFINYSLKYNLHLKMISKTTLALSAFLLLLSVSQALKVNSHNEQTQPEAQPQQKVKYTPVTDYTDPPFMYAVGKTVQNNDELNSKSELSSAVQKTNYWNNTIYKLNFTTNGVQSTYRYEVSQEKNWPEVVAAIKLLEATYPAATSNLYPSSFSQTGVKGQNLTIVFDIAGTDSYTNLYAEVGVDADLKATIKLLSVTCRQSAVGCFDDRFALQIFNANNKFITDNPDSSNLTYDLSAFKVTKLFDDASKRTLTVEQTLTPRESGEKTFVVTISVTPKTFDVTYA